MGFLGCIEIGLAIVADVHEQVSVTAFTPVLRLIAALAKEVRFD